MTSSPRAWPSLLSPILVQDVDGTLCLGTSLYYCPIIHIFSFHVLPPPLFLRRSCHYAELSCLAHGPLHQTSGGGRTAAPQPSTLWSSPSPSCHPKDKQRPKQARGNWQDGFQNFNYSGDDTFDFVPSKRRNATHRWPLVSWFRNAMPNAESA